MWIRTFEYGYDLGPRAVSALHRASNQILKVALLFSVVWPREQAG